jgi:hypothetical protein
VSGRWAEAMPTMSQASRVSALVANSLIFLNLIQRGPVTGQAGLVGFDSNVGPSLHNVAAVIARLGAAQAPSWHGNCAISAFRSSYL